jgi:hypothetical protein
LDFFHLIRALLNRDAIAVADPALQLRNVYLQNGSKFVQLWFADDVRVALSREILNTISEVLKRLR